MPLQPTAAPSPPEGHSVAEQIARGIGIAVVLILGGAVAVSIIGSSASKTETRRTADPIQIPVAKEKTWTEIKRWKGTGQKQTESFAVASGEWRISYKSVTATPGLSLFQIYVYDADSQQLLTVAANRADDGSDISYVQGRGGGRYYLMINAVSNWGVVVEDQR